MVRRYGNHYVACWSSPHPRGDGPYVAEVAHKIDEFSPPAWGWSAIDIADGNLEDVLPTRVGMVRAAMCLTSLLLSSPHPRGDGPERAL